MILDRYLVEHCSPTLACLKTANMFSCGFECIDSLKESIVSWNEAFCGKGVELVLLKVNGNRALVYVCRKSRLEMDLQKDGVADFLCECGYSSTNIEEALTVLQNKLASSDEFPHEIGIFLDYPLDDVKGFIENAGANCKCSGCWKVYTNEAEAAKRFRQFKKCREVYSRLWKEGSRSIVQLTV